MLFKVDLSKGEPVYAQIMGEIKRRMARGTLKPGDRLPSVRDLARSLVINPNTAAKAYQLLETEGVIATRRGTGTYVAGEPSKLSLAVRRARVNALADDLLTEAYHMGFDEASLLELLQARAKSFRLSTSKERRK